MQKYDLTVVVPTYNQSNLVGFTIESILNQRLTNKRVRVVVVNDGSTDDSLEVIRKYKDEVIVVDQQNMKGIYIVVVKKADSCL